MRFLLLIAGCTIRPPSGTGGGLTASSGLRLRLMPEGYVQTGLGKNVVLLLAGWRISHIYVESGDQPQSAEMAYGL